MRKTFKKILSAALAAAILFGSMGAGVVGLDSGRLFAPKASAASVEDLTYKIENDEIIITGCYENASGELEIPAAIDGKPVTGIGGWAFSECESLTSVTIPDSVTSIGYKAFYGCASLTSVTIGNGVTNIGGDAFLGCTGLTSVTIGSGLTSIGDSRLLDSPNLAEITAASDNPNYSSLDGVLFNKDKTELIKYPPKKAGAEYTIPDSVTSIGERAFRYCESLTSVTIPDGVTSIGEYAFDDCRSLTGVTIPDGVTSVGGSAFSGCAGLTSVTIGNGVTSIGWWAFGNCTSLTSVTIPDSVTSIGHNAFDDTGIYNDENNWENGVLYIGNHLIDAKSDVVSGDYTIKAGTKTIAGDAFYGCKSLTSVKIPDSVTSIGDAAFCVCTSLTSVTIGNGVTSIGKYAFAWCENLTNVTIGNGVTSIRYDAFAWCEKLTSVIIPDSVMSIGGEAFAGCKKLTSVKIGNGVTSIGWNAFNGCECLKSITIPDSVTSIGEDAFRDCTSLTSVKIGNGVTSIGYGAFCDCTSLTSVTIPDSVTSIGDYAFDGCTGLTSVTIGSGLTSLSGSYLLSSSNLAEITVASGNPEYSSLDGVLFNKDKTVLIQYPRGNVRTAYTIPDGVTSIGRWAFAYCTGLTSVTIPDSVTSIGDYAFRDCYNLTSVTIPYRVAYIEDGAFYECKSLTSVTIPDSVTYIGQQAFNFCSALKDVYYGGSESDWGNISINYGNESLLNATIHYNSAPPAPPPACEHQFTETVTKAPTCTEPGVKTFTCSKCGYSYTETIPALGHDFGTEWKSDASGHWHECTVCGAKGNQASHTFTSKITKQPTDTEPGEKKYTCSICGYSYTEAIPALSFTPEDFEIKIDAPEMKYGETNKITVGALPEGYEVRYKAEPEGIVEVDKNGNIKTVGEGTATVTATVVDANGNEVKDANGRAIAASQKVTVKRTLMQKIVLFFENILTWLRKLFSL